MTIIIASILGAFGFKLTLNRYFKKYNYQVSILRTFGGSNQAVSLRAKKVNDKLVFTRNNKGLISIPFPENQFIEVAYGGAEQWATSVRLNAQGIVIGWDKTENALNKLCQERLTSKQRSFYRREYQEALDIKGRSNLRLILNQIIIPLIFGLIIVFAIMGAENYFETIATVSNQYGSSVSNANDIMKEMNYMGQTQVDQLRLAGVTLHDVKINVSERLAK